MRNIYNGMIDAHLVHCASPRHGVRSRASDHHPPVCARFAHLDWGYEAFSLSEAGKRVKNSEAGKRVKNSETDSPYRVAKRSHL